MSHPIILNGGATETQMAMHAAHLARRERLWGATAEQVFPPLPVVEPPNREAWGVPVNLLSVSSPHVILRLVALKHTVHFSDMTGPCRTRVVVAARHEAVGIVYTHCRQVSLPALGRLFKRDHTTILHALRKLRRTAKSAPYRRAEFINRENIVEPESWVAPAKACEQLEDRHSSEAVN
jgi:hypothetical protein